MEKPMIVWELIIFLLLFVTARGIHDHFRKYDFERSPFWKRPLLFVVFVVFLALSFVTHVWVSSLGVSYGDKYTPIVDLAKLFFYAAVYSFSIAIAFSSMCGLFLVIFAPSEDLP